MRLAVGYQSQNPDPALSHPVPFNIVFDNLSKVMDNNLTTAGKLLVTGDFNFHIDIPGSSMVKCMLHVFDMMGLHQRVNEPTHKMVTL